MGNLLGAPITEKETHRGSTTEGLQYGVSSMQGWRIHMEDAHICQPYLFAEERIAADGAADGAAASSATAANKSKWNRISVPGHSLYAVFDGHGGTFAAEYSGLNMCRVLSRQLKFVEYAKHVERQAELAKAGGPAPTEEERQLAHRAGLDLLEGALRDAFVDIDREIVREMKGLPVEDASAPYGEDFDEHHSHGQITNPDDDDMGINVGVERDADPANPDQTPPPGGSNAGGGARSNGNRNNGPARPPDYEDSGTTAIVVVLTPQSIVCANAGDSRAVYCKADRAVPLSYDHKPDDEDEERRIKDAGGYVSGGRVEGDLAVSRGLGDFRFKDVETVLHGLGSPEEEGGVGKAAASAAKSGPEGGSESKTAGGSNHNKASSAMIRPEDQKVSSVPDVIVQRRDPDQDEFIVVACDGIWDVQTNLECVKMVAEMFAEGESEIGLVCEEVLDICLRRGSKDNMTALVVKMESQKIGEGGGVKARRELREAAANAPEGEQGPESEKRKRDEFFSGSPAYS